VASTRLLTLVSMPDQHEIRATSDHMVRMLDQLRDVEMRKRETPIGTPEFVGLAEEAEHLSRMVFRWSGLQMQLASQSQAAVRGGTLDPEPITAIEPRPLDRVLALWREAQIRLETARPGSEEAEAAANDIERLREEFHATTEAKLIADDGGLRTVGVSPATR